MDSKKPVNGHFLEIWGLAGWPIFAVKCLANFVFDS
jgi:hypothetical protein